ncbi:MAG TPA: hypothetical protein VNO31_24565 [Umezawaea sp.]|nr:hypothetical protein [Umezawaea sp.]
MTTQDRPDRMSEDEMRQLATLLNRYCEVELDQWDCWRSDTSFGEAYIYIARKPPPDWPPDSFLPLPR